jgi:hypothetical protein
VRGGVVTRQLRGGQRLAAVEGNVDLDGVEGDMDLKDLNGGRVDARLVDGSIRAEDVRADLVRLVTTTGQIVLIGLIRPGAHYDLRSYGGDVRYVATGGSASFELRARSTSPLDARVPLHNVRRDGAWMLAEYLGRRGTRAHPALLELSSALCRVMIQPRTETE